MEDITELFLQSAIKQELKYRQLFLENNKGWLMETPERKAIWEEGVTKLESDKLDFEVRIKPQS